jgi:hypothetical protein
MASLTWETGKKIINKGRGKFKKMEKLQRDIGKKIHSSKRSKQVK